MTSKSIWSVFTTLFNLGVPTRKTGDFLKENKGIKILLEGHTDNMGNVILNKELSLDRASTIRDFLVRQGVEFERIRVIGWGGAKPISTNQDEEGRSKNRRVEMVILEE